MSNSILVTGGARSGKSSFALKWAIRFPPPRFYIATALPLDQEMEERIRRHQTERGEQWATVEEPFDVEQVVSGLSGKAGVVVLDCLTLWVSNLMHLGLSDLEIEQRGLGLCGAIRDLGGAIAVVTNEVGWGVVPENHIGRRFRDLSGRMNQQVAGTVQEVILMVAGIGVPVKRLTVQGR